MADHSVEEAVWSTHWVLVAFLLMFFDLLVDVVGGLLICGKLWVVEVGSKLVSNKGTSTFLWDGRKLNPGSDRVLKTNFLSLNRHKSDDGCQYGSRKPKARKRKL